MKKLLLLVVLSSFISQNCFSSDAMYDRRCHCDGDVKISFSPPIIQSEPSRCKDAFENINERINNSNRKYVFCKIKNSEEDHSNNYRLIGDFDKNLDIKFVKNNSDYENSCE